MRNDATGIDVMDRIGTVSVGIGLGERAIRDLRSKGKFPEPIVIGEKAVAWPRSVWQAWLRRRAAGVAE